MPMLDWTRVRPGIYHNFHFLWISAVTNRLNTGILPGGMIAMAEQIIGGPEPDVVALQQNDFAFTDTSGAGNAVMTEALAKPQTAFVMPLEVERYSRKANRVVIRHSLGRVVAVIEVVSPGNKDSLHSIRSFVEKAVDLIFEGINLLVVDPFPPGPRDRQGIHSAIWSEFTDQPFELPHDRPLTIVSYQTTPIKTAYVEPIAMSAALPDMPLFLKDNYYINVPLESTYMETWNVLPQALRDIIIQVDGEQSR